MRVAIGCDHGGIDIKRQILRQLSHDQHQALDLGCDSNESVDYPAYAQAVCRAILDGKAERGILICGTGIGMSMVANRFAGIRAALCHELFTARMSREHNDANVLCLGARVVGPGLIYEIVATWLATEFAGGRHLRRIEMF
ncbi:MAG: ribose 5-phosphate isomerase B [Desulfobacteraceae bacterium]|nr:ribose 5-phosphate isomerase B [Desulfobacteraceae bacterium]